MMTSVLARTNWTILPPKAPVEAGQVAQVMEGHAQDVPRALKGVPMLLAQQRSCLCCCTRRQVKQVLNCGPYPVQRLGRNLAGTAQVINHQQQSRRSSSLEVRISAVQALAAVRPGYAPCMSRSPAAHQLALHLRCPQRFLLSQPGTASRRALRRSSDHAAGTRSPLPL